MCICFVLTALLSKFTTICRILFTSPNKYSYNTDIVSIVSKNRKPVKQNIIRELERVEKWTRNISIKYAFYINVNYKMKIEILHWKDLRR